MSKPQRASLGATLLEWRAVFEYARFNFSYRQLLEEAPTGDGHAVLVIPGFMTSDFTTEPLRRALSELGYQPYGWQQGINSGPTPQRQKRMEAQLKRLYRKHGRVSIVGWSLGGIYARELAHRHPEMVRQVITLGSPFQANDDDVMPLLVKLMEKSTGKTIAELKQEFMGNHDGAPPVPCTAVYSRTDGIVHWRLCLETPSDRHQNVEVYGSHCGLAVNLSVLYLIADRLARPDGDEQPFVAPWQYQSWYPKPRQ